MTQRGGKRLGAGRPKGSKDKATREAGATIAELAREHSGTAIETLSTIAQSGESESARVSAANAILDRGYGKPPQAIEYSGEIKSDGPLADISDEEAANMLVDRMLEAWAAMQAERARALTAPTP